MSRTSASPKGELRKVPDPCVVVIFGASGDLTERKLMPALFSLACEGLLPEQFSVVGVARSELDHDAFRAKTREGIQDQPFISIRQGVFTKILFVKEAHID